VTLDYWTRSNSFAANIDEQMEGAVVVALQPGWVKTRMGGRRAPLLAADSVRAILALTDRLGPADAGKFFNYDGTEIDW
jgi:hypothetical protein